VIAVPEPSFVCAADALTSWRDDLLSGTPPVLYAAGAGDLAHIEIGPGLVTLLGGAPGAGKTAFSMQLVIDALRMTDTLRAVVCNVEMGPPELLNRQLARLSGIHLTSIRRRQLGHEHADRLVQGFATLEPVCERLAFVRPPFTLENVAGTADAFDADLLLLDYIQRIPPPGQHGDRRGAVDASMSYLRQFADAARAVVVVAAVARTKDKHGRSSYGEGLNLASYRESSELEFGADDAYMLGPDQDDPDVIILRHLKSRYGEPHDIALAFDGRLQRFTPLAHSGEGTLPPQPAAQWGQTPADDDDAELNDDADENYDAQDNDDADENDE
jgi:replicative DNA helicase